MGRIGVSTVNGNVVVASDFSVFAYMLEEYISLSITRIAVRKSAPEVSQLSKMPPMLRKHVYIIDDDNAIESINRLLHPIWLEIGVAQSNDENDLLFPEGMTKRMQSVVLNLRGILVRLALGFNTGTQISINPAPFIRQIGWLRQQLSNLDARAVLANIEGILNAYEDICFEL